jgi:hypothetical protein
VEAHLGGASPIVFAIVATVPLSRIVIRSRPLFVVESDLVRLDVLEAVELVKQQVLDALQNTQKQRGEFLTNKAGHVSKEEETDEEGMQRNQIKRLGDKERG